MALCLAGMTAACGLAGGGEPEGEKETDKGQEEAVIHVLVTTHAWTKDIEDIPSFQELSEKTGVKVVWEQVRSGWEEKKNAILSQRGCAGCFSGRGHYGCGYFGLSGAVPSAERLRGGTGSQCDENV